MGLPGRSYPPPQQGHPLQSDLPAASHPDPSRSRQAPNTKQRWTRDRLDAVLAAKAAEAAVATRPSAAVSPFEKALNATRASEAATSRGPLMHGYADNTSSRQPPSGQPPRNPDVANWLSQFSRPPNAPPVASSPNTEETPMRPELNELFKQTKEPWRGRKKGWASLRSTNRVRSTTPEHHRHIEDVTDELEAEAGAQLDPITDTDAVGSRKYSITRITVFIGTNEQIVEELQCGCILADGELVPDPACTLHANIDEEEETLVANAPQEPTSTQSSTAGSVQEPAPVPARALPTEVPSQAQAQVDHDTSTSRTLGSICDDGTVLLHARD